MAPKTKTAKKQELLSIKSQPKAPVEVPDWPPITTLVPAADLSFVPLLPDHILTVPQLWTTSLCRSYVSFLSTLTMATTPGKPKRGEAVRFNDRFQVDDAHFAEKLWTGTALKEMVGQPSVDGRSLDDTERRALWGGDVLGLNSNIRVYRYTKGQFFDQHCRSSHSSLGSRSRSTCLTACRRRIKQRLVFLHDLTFSYPSQDNLDIAIVPQFSRNRLQRRRDCLLPRSTQQARSSAFACRSRVRSRHGAVASARQRLSAARRSPGDRRREVDHPK